MPLTPRRAAAGRQEPLASRGRAAIVPVPFDHRVVLTSFDRPVTPFPRERPDYGEDRTTLPRRGARKRYESPQPVL